MIDFTREQRIVQISNVELLGKGCSSYAEFIEDFLMKDKRCVTYHTLEIKQKARIYEIYYLEIKKDR